MDIDSGPGRNEEEVVFEEDKVRLVYIYHEIQCLLYNLLIVCLSELQVARLKEISKQPDIYEILTKSLAPNIWELDDVKKGLLCQVRHLLIMHSLIAYQFSEGANI